MFVKAAVLLKRNKVKILNLKKPDLKPYQVYVVFAAVKQDQVLF